MTESSSTTLPAVLESFSIMTIDPDELREIIRENIGEQLSRLDLPTVRMPTAGGTTWTIPDVEGDVTEKTLRGVVIYQTTARGYWAETFDSRGGGTPPSCYSNDGKRGVGTPGGDCAKCPLNQWGSDRRGGHGKARREMRLIFMLRENTVLPLVVVMPPTSIKVANQYFLKLRARRLPSWRVITEITVVQAISRTGIKYAKAAFRASGRLSPAQTARLKPSLEVLTPALSRVWAAAEAVLARAFRAKEADEAHRARLRVEVGRLRAELEPLAGISATRQGFVLVPRRTGK
jgi:hypothetical protein